MTDNPAYNPDHDNSEIDTPGADQSGSGSSRADLGKDHLETDDAFTRDPDSATTEISRPDSPVHTGPGRSQPGSASNLQLLAAQVLAPLGYELLEVQVQNPGKRPTVVVRIDRQDEQPVSIEDLAAASRAVGAEYDRTDPIQGEYRLELESPGAKRPLLNVRHFERMMGLKARVRGDGHSFTGPIVSIQDDLVTFETTDGNVTLKIGQFQANLAEFPSEHR
jgi:ribosome maturation factor RimP